MYWKKTGFVTARGGKARRCHPFGACASNAVRRFAHCSGIFRGGIACATIIHGKRLRLAKE